jgi:hypothetical protein
MNIWTINFNECLKILLGTMQLNVQLNVLVYNIIQKNLN